MAKGVLHHATSNRPGRHHGRRLGRPGGIRGTGHRGAGERAGGGRRRNSDYLGAVLVGGNEVPGPGDTDAWGLADVTVEPGEVCWRVSTATAVTRPLAAGHIHAGPVGVAGPVVIPLDPIRAGCADVPRH